MRPLALLVLLAATPVFAQSVYTVKPDDPAAITVSGTGGDDIQRAIDQVAAANPSGQGIVFLPEARYTITHTLYVSPGVRVLGFGAHRPVLSLPANTPGYQHDPAYMVMFTGGRPSQRRRPQSSSSEPFPGTVPPLTDVYDANPGTFYSAMSNVDFEIGEGNPAAVGIRFHIAQHCFLTHMDFRLGSGLAGIKDAGNEAEDLHFHGGQFGIITSKPSPGWQFTVLDSTFDGQREAGIQEHEAGLTLIRSTIRNTPTAISIDPGYAEELWVQQSRFENISGPAIVISNEKNERTEISLADVICSHVPTLAQFRESGHETKAPADRYTVKLFTHGLDVPLGGDASIHTTADLAPLKQLPAPLAPRIRPIPDSASWINVHSLGVKGDGTTDDTAALEAAVRNHKILYLPTGRYLVSRPITLKPDTILIGLHPSTTQLDLADHNPLFDGPGAPLALLTTPSGGTNIVSGIGIYPGGANSRAAGVMWQSGADSLMDDVRFLGGHGTSGPDGRRTSPYNANHTADPDPMHPWDAQYPSLWVLNGGGGVFTDIWTPDTFAQAGMYVSNTQTEGHVYELSSEHHVRTEIKLTHAANWEFVALQTEEEWGEGGACLPLEIDDSNHILIANMHSYRVVGSKATYPYAIRVAHSRDVTFRNLHVDSDSKVSFNDAVYDQDTNTATRFRELGTLKIPPTTTSSSTEALRPVAAGFYNISGATSDAAGNLYFIDPSKQKIYRFSETNGLDVLRDAPLDAANLAVDLSGNLMVISYAGKGTVYSFKPSDPLTELTILKPQPTVARPGKTPYLPNDNWALRRSILNPELFKRAYQYVSLDGSTFIPARTDFVEGQLYYGTKMSDVLRSFSLAKATPGKPFYVTDEEEHKTYSVAIATDGSMSDPKLFAERGGESVVSGPNGNVYIAAGEVFVYSPDGKLLKTITTPERPIDLIFGGKDHGTLYILARTSLYSVRP